MLSQASNVIPFPLTPDDRLRIATRRLALAIDAQSEAIAGLRSFLAPLANLPPALHQAALNKG
ncbi:MAG: hypothetical protein V4653_20105 [Pseudomonadota bacterium]